MAVLKKTNGLLPKALPGLNEVAFAASPLRVEREGNQSNLNDSRKCCDGLNTNAGVGQVSSRRLSLGLCLSLSAFLGMADSGFAQVVIDGSTPTTVTVGADGAVTVGIAPASTSGVSLNNYDQFNVRAPGVNLDNRVQGARTIVNEVTGTSQSKINGQVEVLGQSSHVIIANPNGISVDGGSFVNTGRVALTTGDISINAREIAPGIFQENVVSTTGSGAIQIHGGGLSGQMDAIDLIAHNVRVNGPINNTSTDPQASINIVAGSSRTEFDSSVLPGNLDQNWESVTGSGVTSQDSTLVEITTPGALRSNRIEIQVTDLGAGARIAGDALATSREFILRADGQIDLTGSHVQAATDATITGGSVRLDTANVQADNGALNIIANDTAGSGIAGNDVTLSGDTMALSSEGDIFFSATNLGSSSFVTDTGDLVLTTKGSFSDHQGLWESAAQLSFGSLGDFSLQSSTLEAASSISIDTQGALDAQNTQARASDHIVIAADEAAFSGDTRRTEFAATNGGLILTTLGLNSNGDLVNSGSLLQGGQFVEGLEDAAGTTAEGATTLNIAGTLYNVTDGDSLAVVFGNAGDVVIRTSGNIENEAGRLLANGDVRLIAEGNILNLIDLPDGVNDPEVVTYTRKGKRQWWTLWIKRRRETFVSYDYGTVKNSEQLASITATGNVTIEANDLTNRGGEINANGGDVTITAVNILTEGVGSGRAYVRKVCVLTCSYEGSSDVTYLGGSINAANDVNITATESFTNIGGEVVALSDVTITTPNASFEAVLVPTVVNRPAGLYNFWASKAAWLYLRDRFGGIIADTGNITINSNNSVQLTGAELLAGGDIIIPNGTEIVREPRVISPVFDHEIGLFHDIPPVSWE